MQDETYALQHFGFCATQVALERKHLLTSFLVSAFESMIKKATKTESTANLLNILKNEVYKNVMNDLETELQAIENLDRKYFNVPEHVLLVSDFDHAKIYTDEMEQEIDNDIEVYKKLFLENNVVILSLQQQEGDFEAIKPFIDVHLKTIEIVKTSMDRLNQNKLCNAKTLARATEQVVKRLQEKRNE